MLDEKITGLTGLTHEKIRQLEKIFDAEHSKICDYTQQPQHLPTCVTDIEETISYLLDISLSPTETKVLDLGSGHGFVVAVLAASGFNSYGVEKDLFVAVNSVRSLGSIPEDLGRSFLHKQGIMSADYYDLNFPDQLFRDGATPRDMDVFYCCYYDNPCSINPSTREHQTKIVNSLSYAKPGSILLCTPGYFSEEFLKERRFIAFDRHIQKF